MAENGRRQVVSDPLAQRAGGQTPDRSLGTGGIRRPSGPGDGALQSGLSAFAALGRVQAAVVDVLATKQDEYIVQGKMDYLTGKTEQEALSTGNKYTQQGYQTLSAIDQGSSWYQNQLLAIDDTGRDMTPAQYKAHLMQQRSEALSNLPDDPAVRKVYVAAFEEYGPRLVERQFVAHNERNKTKEKQALSSAAYSSAGANEDASRVMPGGPLRVSPGVVSPQVQTSAEDRDVGIRTMLGEAGGEGEFGMAAVAHVLKNRAIDGRYGGTSIKAVALSPKQFSAWNTGPGGIPAIREFQPESRAYQRAAKVYDAVMSGHHADPTDGATHYYSPKGMELLVKQGAQKNLVPSWWGQQAALGSVNIGNHRFAGKAKGLDGYVATVVDQRDLPPGTLPSMDSDAGAAADEGTTAHAFERGRDLSVVSTDDPNAVASAAGVPLKHTTGKSQVRQMFDASTLRDEDKAEAAADAMIRGLEEGSDQAYNDLGGLGYLRSLGADDSTINAVQSAFTKQVKTSQDKFNVDTERRTEDFKAAVKAGEFKSAEEVLTAVNGLQDELGQDEAWAHSLASTVLTDYNKVVEDDKALNPELASDLAGITRQLIEDPTYTGEQASADAVKLGELYDIDGKVVQGWISKMWGEDQSRRNKAAAEAVTLQKKVQKEGLVKAQVESALKRNSGLSGIKGNVTVTKDGNEVEVSAQEYGIQLLKNNEIANAMSLIEKKQLDPARAEAIVDKIVYEKLAKHGVTDEEHGRELVGALKGNLISKDGNVNEDATKAFDFWLQMKLNPNVGPEYMATMVKDPDVRTLLNVAEHMYSGRLDLNDALRKASLAISEGADPEAKIVYNEKFQAQVGKGVDDSLNELLYDPWFKFDAYTDAQREDVNINRNLYREDIKRRADGYHIVNPRVDPSVSIRMAVEDFKNDSIVVGGTLVTGSYAQGRRLDQVMGVEAFGKDAPQRALDSYLAQHGEEMFPNLLTGPGNSERTGSWLAFTANALFDSNPVGAVTNKVFGLEQLNLEPTRPIYHVQYNSTDGTLAIQLWKNSDREELIGRPWFVPAADVSADWLETQRVPGTFSNVVRSVKEDIVNGSARIQENDAGLSIGRLVAPE
jgi:spore germination cell wall hydrolase CwlJ-like protein